MPDPLVLPRRGRLRAGPPTTSWWARAFVRSFEELTVDAGELVAARRLARSGRLGATVVITGMASAVVDPQGEESWIPQVRVERLDASGWRVLVREAARESGFAAALEAGDLPVELVERADEAGAEVLPGPEAITTGCDCAARVQPCVHVLALLQQLAWSVDTDPYVLLLLRGRTREALLEQIDEAVTGPRSGPTPGSGERDDARARAAQILALAQEAPSGHGLADARSAAYDETVSRLL